MGRQESIDLDVILGELGQFGRYQVLTYCFILLPIVFSAVYNSQYIFTAGETRYRCAVEACELTPPVFDTLEWGPWALPPDSRCQRRRHQGGTCDPHAFLNDTETCHSWVYENNHTIVSTFDLGCEDWKQRLVGTIHSLGLFVALPYTGYISDTFGRRSAFILTSVCAGVVGLVRSFSPNYIMYVIFEFLDAVFGSGVYSTGFILALEMVGPKRRVLGGNIISVSYALGQVGLALAAWAWPHWRMLTLILYVPSLLFIFYYLFIEESVRWLLSKGNKKEAARIIYKAAAINKKKLSPETIKQLNEGIAPPQSDTTKPALEENKTSLALEILRSRVIMTRLAICSFWWITVTFIYYGLSINSVSLAGNMYVNYILTSLVEIPGYALSVLALDRLGRKASIMSAFFVCGSSLVVFPFIPQHLTWLQTCLTMLGKLCISMSFSSIYIYTSELFPTQARHRLLATCSMFGRIGSIVAPQTPFLRRYMESLPYLLFGVMAGGAGLLMMLTPETLNKRLPDTVAQAEGIAAKEQELD